MLKNVYVRIGMVVGILLAVLFLMVSVVGATPPETTAMCNPGGQGPIDIPNQAIGPHLNQGWTLADGGSCPNGQVPDDDGGDEDDGDNECEVDCDDDDDDDTPPIVIEIVEPEPAQGLWQVTVWPDTAQVGEGLVGFIWTVNGSPIFSDANGNGIRDAGEPFVVTQVEHRDRNVQHTSQVVQNQAMSRLVTSFGWPDDVAPSPANYRAYAVFAGDTENDVFARGFVFGWYDVDGEFNPITYPNGGESIYIGN